MMKSLYIHFPFCETKCHYCDFYSIARERVGDGEVSQYESALYREAQNFKGALSSEMDTIFFGGGTPSMTAPEAMQKSLEPLQLLSRVTSKTEWTMEANPSSINVSNMKKYRALGVNRVSMGVQAFRDDLLLKLGRVHDRKAAITALEDVFSAGFSNVSVDLLCGVPGQTIDDLKEALSIFTQFGVTHLSCYILTLPQHHRMFAELPTDEIQLEHYMFVDDWMKSQGFHHYEISNFAKPGFEARHNLAYWTNKSYLGLGPSAHSYDASKNQRWKNISSLKKYSISLEHGGTPVEWTENLNPEQLEMEKWMLAVRLSAGFPVTWLASEKQKAKSETFLKQGLMEPHPEKPDFVRLTVRGFALSEQIVREII